MHITFANHQRTEPIPTAWLRALARRSLRALRVTHPGTLPVVFVDARTMRRLNRTFLRHDRLTDVLSFRYAPPHQTSDLRLQTTVNTEDKRLTIVGEIVVAPAAARAYAIRHRLPYRQELARYVVHGLLHWVGYEDRTPGQQRLMRQLEDRLLTPSDLRLQTSVNAKHEHLTLVVFGVTDV